MVLETLTWIHLCTSLVQASRSAFVVAGMLLLVQRWVGDTHMHPIIYLPLSFMLAELYRADGQRIEPIVPVWPVTSREWLRIAGYVALMVFDVVWAPVVGLMLIMVVHSIVDRAYLFKGRGGTLKLILMLPVYMFIIASKVSVRPRVEHIAHLGIVVVTTAECVILASLTRLKGSGWLMGSPSMTRVEEK